MCVVYGNQAWKLPDIHICCICLLSFAGFLRISESLNIKRSDIIFNDDHMSLFVEKSKTDCYRERSSVIIARTDEVTFPVRMLTRYLQIANIS